MSSTGVKKYAEMFGSVPAPIVSLFEMDEEFAGHFADIRELAFRERPDGNSAATKDLMCVIVNTVIGNKEGAVNHTRKARRGGVSEVQLREALYIVFLITGTWSWSSVGHAVWQAWNSEE
jgi:AhpD family alkylhydroperoxidase